MKIDLCKLFGVEEGEEFKIDYGYFTPDQSYQIKDNQLYEKEDDDSDYIPDDYYINDLRNIKNIIKLPKKKEFSDDELAIMRSLPKKYEWISRDGDDMLYVFCSYKPKKENNYWDIKGLYKKLDFFDHLFQQIQWQDEEPVFIDDYVER